MRRHHRRAAHPVIEPVERRELLSGLMVALAAQARPSFYVPGVVVNAATNETHATAGGSGSGSSGGTAGGSGSSSSFLSPLMGQGQPTPHEQAREAFFAAFNGPFWVGPGRFTDQAKIYFMQGTGGSNMFHHGNFNMAIVIPTDPTAPITGVAVLNDKNTNGSGIVGLDLTAPPGSLDALGRPTTLTFTADPNIYSGIFFADTANGTVQIRYHGAAANVAFTGSIYTSGLTNPLRNASFVARGPRLHARSV
jgi:hypothetical protein